MTYKPQFESNFFLPLTPFKKSLIIPPVCLWWVVSLISFHIPEKQQTRKWRAVALERFLLYGFLSFVSPSSFSVCSSQTGFYFLPPFSLSDFMWFSIFMGFDCWFGGFWISGLCSRTWSVSESNGQVISRRRHEQELQIVSEDSSVKIVSVFASDFPTFSPLILLLI